MHNGGYLIHKCCDTAHAYLQWVKNAIGPNPCVHAAITTVGRTIGYMYKGVRMGYGRRNCKSRAETVFQGADLRVCSAL